MISKAQKALERYGHNLVIGNILSTRKTNVVFVKQDGVETLELSPEQTNQGVEIESLIIEKLGISHNAFIDSSH